MAAVLVFAALGCSSNRLDGSAGETWSLTFDRVHAEVVLDDLVVRYLSGEGRGRTEPVRITLARSAADTGSRLPLDGVRFDHYVAERQSDGTVVEEPPFPVATSGWLRFDRVGSSLGRPVSGEFAAVLEGGRTLNGGFDTLLSEPE